MARPANACHYSPVEELQGHEATWVSTQCVKRRQRRSGKPASTLSKAHRVDFTKGTDYCGSATGAAGAASFAFCAAL